MIKEMTQLAGVGESAADVVRCRRTRTRRHRSGGASDWSRGVEWVVRGGASVGESDREPAQDSGGRARMPVRRRCGRASARLVQFCLAMRIVVESGAIFFVGSAEFSSAHGIC